MTIGEATAFSLAQAIAEWVGQHYGNQPFNILDSISWLTLAYLQDKQAQPASFRKTVDLIMGLN